jgi:hypothetical protein
MANKCKHHPGRTAVFEYDGVHYCEKCKTGYEAAVQKVKLTNGHVEPKECFVVYAGSDIWNPIPGTGCAHWVSHEKNLKITGGSATCLKGFRFRVKDLATYCRSHGTQIKNLKDVKVGDIWISGNEGHTGLVIRVNLPPDPKKTPDYKSLICIRHDSSGQGKVAENLLQWLITAGGHGPAEGTFHRLR